MTDCDQFQCLLCCTTVPSNRRGSSDNDHHKNMFKMVFVLHKLLQIPLWDCSKYLFSDEDGTTNRNALQLCTICATIVEEGQSLVEKVELVQLKLQTLQATLQNQLLSGQNAPILIDGSYQTKLRENIRDEIRNNICRSAIRHSTSSGGDGVDIEIEEPTQPKEATIAQSTEIEATAQGEETAQMKFEVGEVKVEPLGEDPLSLGYELIDLVGSDSEEHGSVQHSQDWDALIAEVAGGSAIDESIQGQHSVQQQASPWSSTSSPSPSSRIDISPLPGSPQRKRMYSIVENDSQDSRFSPSCPVQAYQHLPVQQSHQPGTSRQYHQPQQMTPPVTVPQTQQASSLLLQMLLNRTAQTAQPASPVIRGKQVVWSGILEWHEKRKGGLKLEHQMSCRIYGAVVNHISIVNSAGWPSKFHMQCIPKSIISAIGPSGLEAKTVLFEFDQPLSPQVQVMTSVLNGENAGCIHFLGADSTCTTKLMILVYVMSRGAYVGIIPEQQNEFIAKLKNTIQIYNQRSLARQIAQQIQNSAGVNNANISQIISNRQSPSQNLMQPQPPHGATIHHMPSSSITIQAESHHRQENLIRIQQTLGQEAQQSYHVIQGNIPPIPQNNQRQAKK